MKKLTCAPLWGAHVAFVLFAATAATAQSNGPSAIESLGASPCSALVDPANAQSVALNSGFAGFLAGYLSAANAYEADTFDLTPWQPIEVSAAQVRSYCVANPTANIITAAASYVAFLQPDKLSQSSPLVSARNGEHSVFVYAEVLGRVRAALISQGIEVADDETDFGSGLGVALQEYQRMNALQVTGLPDTRTLIKLFGS